MAATYLEEAINKFHQNSDIRSIIVLIAKISFMTFRKKTQRKTLPPNSFEDLDLSLNIFLSLSDKYLANDRK